VTRRSGRPLGKTRAAQSDRPKFPIQRGNSARQYFSNPGVTLREETCGLGNVWRVRVFPVKGQLGIYEVDVRQLHTLDGEPLTI
jgi:hypothetical protein